MDAGQAFFEDMHKRNKQLVKLHADCQARLLPHQGLFTILDLDAFYEAMDLSTHLINIISFENLAITDYKAYTTFSYDSLKFKSAKPFDLDKALKNYFEATHCPDTNVWQTVMEHEINSLQQLKVFIPADLPFNQKAIEVQWVYTYKYNSDRLIIQEIEKA